jgi:sulfane dehydrogenase subunit SoxC
VDGVPLRVLLEEVGVRRDARWFLAEGGDACLFARSIPIEKARDDALVVWAQNGEPLRPEQGFPFACYSRLGGEHQREMASRLELGARPWMTRWETATYTDPLADGTARQFAFEMDAKSIITAPAYPFTLTRGWWPVTGLAWSGRGNITGVEVSTDSGKTWHAASLDSTPTSKAHVRFSHMWNWDGHETILMSRAIDETGYVQPTRGELIRARGPGRCTTGTRSTDGRCRRNGRVFFYGAT